MEFDDYNEIDGPQETILKDQVVQGIEEILKEWMLSCIFERTLKVICESKINVTIDKLMI